MNSVSEEIKVIPCSGMGKVFGLIARESAFKVVTELCPQKASTVCLAYIVTGDDEARRLIEGQKCVTLDGCPAMCAAKNVEMAGGIVLEQVKVVDAYRRHKGAKAGSATELTPEGWQIVDDLADEVAAKVKAIGEV